jgi:short-subunit dehydrogenase
MPTALVTGGTSGIGAAFARALAARGDDLVLVARDADRLAETARELTERHGVVVETLTADLARSDDVSRVAERLGSVDAPIDLLVNNAGFGGYRRFLELDPKVADDLLSVHVRAVVQVTRAALPGMVARKQGGIISVASLLAFSGPVTDAFFPARAVYAGAKAFLVTFTEVLANELRDTGVRANVFLPGVVATEFHEVQGMDLSKVPRMSADDAARASLAGFRLGEVLTAPGMEDASPLQKLAEAQRAALGNARSTTPAARYR